MTDYDTNYDGQRIISEVFLIINTRRFEILGTYVSFIPFKGHPSWFISRLSVYWQSKNCSFLGADYRYEMGKSR